MHDGSPGTAMASELRSQPESWAAAAELQDDRLPRSGSRVAIIGCGTSWFMGQAYAAWRESAGLGETDAFAASEAPLARDYDQVVAISRSGTTTEVLEAVEALRGRIPTLAIVGDARTPIGERSDDVIELPFADERSVVQTRFATSALMLLRAGLGHDVDAIAAQGALALEHALPQEALDAEALVFVGRGPAVGLAHEAALKLRESAQAWTESYPAMDYRHGPIAIAAPGRATWSFSAPPAGLQEQVESLGAAFVHLGLDPMAELVVAQRVALERALRLGLDPDHPRALTRSVVLDAS